MATSIVTPKTLSELVKVIARHGKRAMLVSGVDPASDRVPAGKVVVDLAGIDSLNEISNQKDRVLIGTGLNLGRLVREASGENGLIRQAASLIANPLVRNRITLAQALGRVGPAALNALPVLQEAMKSDHVAVRDAAREAIKAINAKERK